MTVDAGILREVCRLTREAGQKIMALYQKGHGFTTKEDSSPLTLADWESHQHLLNGLSILSCGVPVISEESNDSEKQIAASSREQFWLVDPLDGTKEFLKETGQFTVNVALIEGGRPTLGVIHAPALRRTYWAATGFGAWRADADATPKEIVCRRTAAQLSVVASRDHAGPLVQELLRQLPTSELQSMGSSLKFCLVAEGAADLYLRDLPTMEWDTAAAQCVVESAGGSVSTLDGQPLRYGKDGWRNPAIMTAGDTKFNWRALLSTAENK